MHWLNRAVNESVRGAPDHPFAQKAIDSHCFRPPSSDSKRMPKNYWMVKQEPEAYSWDTFVKEGSTAWTGVRNFQARNNLRAMKKGDMVFFYHSVSDKQVVGLARVAKEHFPDKTAEEGDWSAVELQPVKKLPRPVSLDEMKADRQL